MNFKFNIRIINIYYILYIIKHILYILLYNKNLIINIDFYLFLYFLL